MLSILTLSGFLGIFVLYKVFNFGATRKVIFESQVASNQLGLFFFFYQEQPTLFKTTWKRGWFPISGVELFLDFSLFVSNGGAWRHVFSVYRAVNTTNSDSGSWCGCERGSAAGTSHSDGLTKIHRVCRQTAPQDSPPHRRNQDSWASPTVPRYKTFYQFVFSPLQLYNKVGFEFTRGVKHVQNIIKSVENRSIIHAVVSSTPSYWKCYFLFVQIFSENTKKKKKIFI